ncbi:hypothetical protein [Roseibium sp.]|uniref:hypothetical protein n=1 Tax=Roseibium sp. TaxID=1936156 RepID=UPI003A9755E4
MTDETIEITFTTSKQDFPAYRQALNTWIKNVNDRYAPAWRVRVQKWAVWFFLLFHAILTIFLLAVWFENQTGEMWPNNGHGTDDFPSLPFVVFVLCISILATGMLLGTVYQRFTVGLTGVFRLEAGKTYQVKFDRSGMSYKTGFSESRIPWQADFLDVFVRKQSLFILHPGGAFTISARSLPLPVEDLRVKIAKWREDARSSV